ncbi:hypothetical protein HU200_032458 [Digitaria exilis]|uniref:DUF3615 domain-containing protein n=1 Tax=Digitaria exilis TaxID=1010633 RepID=A0A835ES62_9POAL|nr:hypothetical protein HU200_032458 [Digitaria exilis]
MTPQLGSETEGCAAYPAFLVWALLGRVSVCHTHWSSESCPRPPVLASARVEATLVPASAPAEDAGVLAPRPPCVAAAVPSPRAVARTAPCPPRATAAGLPSSGRRRAPRRARDRGRQTGYFCWTRLRKADDVSSFDMLIRRRLYWPDGTSRRYSRSRELESGRDEMRRLVLALLDNYNDVNYLVEDLAYELKEVSNYQSICEECSWYYHLNFIITSKADGDREVFVEVKYVRQGELLKMFVCCFCFIDPNDKVNLLFVDEGQRCNGCTIIGNVDMKRPDSSVELAAGHSNPYHQCCELVKRESDSEDEVFTAEN